MRKLAKFSLLLLLLLGFGWLFKVQFFAGAKLPSKRQIASVLPSEEVLPVQTMAAAAKQELAERVDGTEDPKVKALENQPGGRIAIAEQYYKNKQYELALPYFTNELVAIKTGDAVYGNRDEVLRYVQSRINEINQKIDE